MIHTWFPVCADALACSLVPLGLGAFGALVSRTCRREIDDQEARFSRRAARDLAEARLEEARARSAEIAAHTLDTLNSLLRGGAVDAPVRSGIAVSEAALRDLIRAPELQHPVLVACIAELRARGVDVILLGAPDAAPPNKTRISSVLASTARQVLEPLQSGSQVHISAASHAEDVALTITIAFPDGGSVRLEFDRTAALLRMH